ncbi:MAG: hypothetical protein ACD_71C00222G0006 [uncultured bacterium (gcode 4)]|uniref:Uncharacterized protein n=1 Tax=uncultured bacterium (gcode 4) TaxID=1234023 RepID=K1Z3R4_9BACT|nr:MAG: hypothetical protein ACD_71C00222G0006 [uncultured bacterium (gcode 4)]
MAEKQSCEFHTITNTTESNTSRNDEMFYASVGKLDDCSEVMERISIEGNKEVWTILYIRQLHKPSLQLRNPLYVNEVLPLLTKYQRSIFELLEKQKSEIIFIEGVTSDQIPVFISDLRNKRERGKISDNEILRNFGWAILYELVYWKNDEVTFLRSWDINVPKVCGIGTLGKIPMNWKDCNALREWFLATEIKAYLKENPGKKIYVVYWAVHVIDDDIRSVFGEENLPFVQEVIFGKLSQNYAKYMTEWAPKYKKDFEERVKNDEPLEIINSDHYREYLPVLEKQWEAQFWFPPYIDDNFIHTIDNLLELNTIVQEKPDWQVSESVRREYLNKQEVLLRRIQTRSSLYIFRKFESGGNFSFEEIMQKRMNQESRIEKEFPKFIEWIIKNIPLLGKTHK